MSVRNKKHASTAFCYLCTCLILVDIILLALKGGRQCSAGVQDKFVSSWTWM